MNGHEKQPKSKATAGRAKDRERIKQNDRKRDARAESRNPGSKRRERLIMLAKITPENADTFDRFSWINATIVMAERRECGCKPYEDVFTYNRWRAMGYQVRKGEHGIKIGTFAPVTDKETKEIIGKRPWTSTVFCLCQVDKIVKN